MMRYDNQVSTHLLAYENVGGPLLRTCNKGIGRVPGKYPWVHLVGKLVPL